jgi:hypothetical protein
VMPEAWERAESRDRHVGQLNSLGFGVLILLDVYAGTTGVQVDVAPFATQDFALRIPVVRARIRNAFSSGSSFSSHTRIIATISSGSGDRSRPGGSFSCGTTLTGFLSYFSKRIA